MSEKFDIDEVIETLCLDIANTAESLHSLEHQVKHFRENLDYWRDEYKRNNTVKFETNKSDWLESLSKEYNLLTKIERSLQEEATFLAKEMRRNGWIWDT